MMENKFKWLPFLWFIFEISCICRGDTCKKETKCSIMRTHGMRAAECYNRNIREFPKCFPGDIEVIELSSNRIRQLKKSDLSQFKYLKILYLQDNLLVNLGDDVFEDMSNLITLDLTMNSLTKLPYSVLQLPSLKTIYLSQNLNINIVDAFETIKPVSSPLMQLDISFTSNEDNIQVFPDFGMLPFLLILNITGNQYMTIAPRHFAGLCSLQTLHNVNITTAYNDNCDCWIINRWLHERKVQFTPFSCTIIENSCMNAKLEIENKNIYNKCREEYKEFERKTRISKISIYIGIGLLMLLVAIIVYLFVIRKKFRKRKMEKGRNKDPPLTPDGMLLLNNRTKTIVDKV